MKANQKLNQMSRDVLTISKISRLTNKLKENGDIKEMVDQSTIKTESSPIFKEEYTCCISDLDTPDLTTSSAFIFSNSSISKILRKIM